MADTTQLRGLTVLEPYATCIIHGTKRIENRTYRLVINNSDGEWIAIHAGISQKLIENDPTPTVIRLQTWPELPDNEVLRQNCGKILGLAKFVACLKAEEVGDDEIWKAPCDAYGSKKQYAWIISEVKPLPTPIACKGQQRIWHVDNELVEKIWSTVGMT